MESRQGFSAVAVGGTSVDEIQEMEASEFTIAIGASMEPAVKILKNRFGIEYMVFESISGLKDMDMFMETLSMLSGSQMSERYDRQKNLIDGMRGCPFLLWE